MKSTTTTLLPPVIVLHRPESGLEMLVRVDDITRAEQGEIADDGKSATVLYTTFGLRFVSETPTQIAKLIADSSVIIDDNDGYNNKLGLPMVS